LRANHSLIISEVLAVSDGRAGRACDRRGGAIGRCGQAIVDRPTA
jgi:hypothetical protein